MRFSVYGRFTLEVAREGEQWSVYRLANGKRMRAQDIVLPAELPAEGIAVFLDDLFHELAGPGDMVQALS